MPWHVDNRKHLLGMWDFLFIQYTETLKKPNNININFYWLKCEYNFHGIVGYDLFFIFYFL